MKFHKNFGPLLQKFLVRFTQEIVKRLHRKELGELGELGELEELGELGEFEELEVRRFAVEHFAVRQLRLLDALL